MNLQKIFDDTDFVHTSGTERGTAGSRVFKSAVRDLGERRIWKRSVCRWVTLREAQSDADGEEIECRACQCCGSGSVEGELYYMPGTDPISIAGAKDKIVLLDMAGVTHFVYQDLMKAGAKAILFQHGNMYYPHADIDQRDLREAVVGDGKKVLCATIHSGEAVRLVKTGVKQIRLEVQQKEYDGKSHNVIAELPGTCDEWIVLSAHYDTTSLSHGAYDNMSGCAGLLGILEQMKEQPRHYGLRFVFCGSEERGLLGSKAYVAAHAEELDKIVLNINLDMIGTYMGKFIACVSAEEKLSHYITYMAAEVGSRFSQRPASTPVIPPRFADQGVPALSFARDASRNVATDSLQVRFKRSLVDGAAAKGHQLPYHIYKTLRQCSDLPGIPHNSGEDQEGTGRVPVPEAERGVK